ncbi:hypothetical protein [Sorangium sp. So ce542]|uniref:hypothetical protein n=1 Tax=Sorangium sp. So ce542 TaxID=3133316 RepID=UPI003F63993D
MQSILMQAGAAAFLCLAAAGCIATAGGEPEDGEELDSASAAQLDGGMKKWRLYTATFANGQPLFRTLAIGGTNVGPYQANTEYWYVTKGNLGYLGQYGVIFSQVDGNSTPPTQSGSQVFEVPRLLPWASFSSDPVSGGFRYDQGSMHLRVGVDGGEISRLTWYQTVPAAQSPANLAPSGLFSVGSGAVAVPNGSAGYSIDSAIP